MMVSLTGLMERIKPAPVHIGERKDGGAILALALHCKMLLLLSTRSHFVPLKVRRSVRAPVRRTSRAASPQLARAEVSSELYVATNITKPVRLSVQEIKESVSNLAVEATEPPKLLLRKQICDLTKVLGLVLRGA